MSPVMIGVLVALGLVTVLFWRPLGRAERWVTRRLGPALIALACLIYLYGPREATRSPEVGMILAVAVGGMLAFTVGRVVFGRRWRRRGAGADTIPTPLPAPLPGASDPPFGPATEDVETFLGQVATFSEDERTRVLASARARAFGLAVTGGPGRRYRKAERALAQAGDEVRLMRVAWATRRALDGERPLPEGAPSLDGADFQLLAAGAAQALALQDRIDPEHFAVLTGPFREVLERRGDGLPGG